MLYQVLKTRKENAEEEMEVDGFGQKPIKKVVVCFEEFDRKSDLRSLRRVVPEVLHLEKVQRFVEVEI